MAAAAGIRAGQAYVELGASDAGLQRGLAAAQAKLKAFADGMRAIGAQLVGVSAAMMAPLALSTRTYAGFEKSMAKVDALTRGQAANSEEAAANYRKLTEEAKRLGEQTEYSASEAAEMMYQFAMRGYQVKEILAATGPALQMATAGNMELAEAAGIAGDIMGGMKIPATELGRVTDIMAKAFSTSATDLRQLGEGFKYVGPTASSMGFSVTEVTAALQVLADAGQKGEMAGTTLRGMLETLKDPSKEARDELNRLGVVLDNGQGKFRDLASIIGDMEKGLGKLSQVDAASSISRIFTNRQTTGTTILVTPDQTGLGAADRIRKKDQALQSAEGTGAAIQARHLDTIWGAWKLIESAIEGVAITIGETLAPTIREWASATIHGIGLLHEIIKANKDWIPVIAKTAIVIGGIGAALFAVGAAVSVAGFAVSGLATAASAVAGLVGAVFSPVILGVAAAVGLVIAVVSEMGVTWEAMTPILKAWGGYVAAAAIVAVGAVMGVIEIVKQAAKAISTTFSEISKWLSKTFPAMMRSIGDGFSSLVKRFAGFFDDLTATFNLAWGGIVNAVMAGDLALAGEVGMAGLKVVWQQGIIFLTRLWRDFAGTFVFLWYDAMTAVALTFNSIWSGLERAWFESFALISTAWGYTVDFMAKTFSKAVGKMAVGWAGFEAIMRGGGPAAVGAAMGKASAEIDKQVEDVIKKIDDERVASNRQVEKDRQALEDKRAGTENAILDSNEKQKNAYRRGTEDLVEQSAKDLAAAQKELAEAIEKANIALAAQRSGLLSGGAAALKAMEEGGVAPAGIMARTNEAVGGPSAGGSASGTFDSSLARFMAGTGNRDIERQRLEEIAGAEKRMVELTGYIMKILDDIRREGGALFK